MTKEMTVEQAIQTSIHQTEIVWIPFSYIAEGELIERCDDSVDCGSHIEFWGGDDDDCEWRVHLKRA